jgi:hypothetical protein
MKVGFLNNQIDNRGTGNAVYDYAVYNEEILGNESRIFTFESGSHDKEAISLYLQRFSQIIPIDIFRQAPSGVDVMYHIKSGYDDGIRAPEGVNYGVHAVFNIEPHGDRYAGISSWLAADRVPFVPHIIKLADTQEDLRKEFSIPKKARVFGRHGGFDSFDIRFVRDSLYRILDRLPDVWFIFLNTDLPFVHSRLISLKGTSDRLDKRRFINTCDAMLHARSRGETFGIAVGEFASLGKPVVTYRDSGEKAHLQELPDALLYSNEEELMDIIANFQKHETFGYTQYTPEKVMAKFNEVFLS